MATKINFGKLSIIFRDEYNENLSYKRLDIVSYEGGLYICIKDAMAGILPVNTEFWRLMITKGKDGADGKSAYEIYRETITHNKEFIIVDHTNFAEARHNQLEDYYNNYPVEAQQDGETWPAFYPPAFPWLVVNHAFDGNIVLKIFFRGEEVMSYIPTAKVEAESGELVDRTYAIIGIPSIDPSFTQYAETSGGTSILTNKDEFKVVIIDNNMSEEEWINSLKGIDGINGLDGQDGKSAYDLYVEQNTTVCNTWLVVDHRNFAEARHNQLEDYYNNYPAEARQDGETWPPFTASKFPWLVVNHNFDGNTTANFYYKDELKLSWKPSAKIEQESGNLVDRTYGILSIPEEFNIPEFTETADGTDVFIDPNDIRVELTTALSLNDWLESLKGSNGIDGINGKSAYEIAVDNGFSGDISAWVDSLKGTNGIDGHDGVDGIDGIDGSNGKSAYELYLESNTTLSNSWLIVDHTNFADARHNQLEDYYNNYPAEANQDGETWPAWTPSAFPWIAVNHNFDGNTTLIVKYLGEEVFRTLPSAEVEQESGNMVQRTYSIWSLPNNLGLTQFTETSQGTAILANPADFRVELISNYMNQSEWLDSLKGTNGIDGINGTNGKSAYELYVDSVQEGDHVLTESEWLESLVAKADMSNVYTKEEVNQKFTDLVGSAPEAFDTLKEISDELTNSSTAVTAIINTVTHKVDSSVVYTKQEIDASIVAYAQPKGNYLTEHQDISNKADKSELPTKVSDLENDSKYLTAIDVSQFLTEHQSLDEYAKKTDISVFLVADDISTKADKSELPTKVSDLENDSKYLTAIDVSQFLTEHQSLDEYAKIEDINTSINDINSSIINSDASIESIKLQLTAINSSWASYLTVESFNEFLEADADETINKFNEIVDFLAGIDTTDDTLYNTLLSINTSINDISSRLHDIDSSWDNYYTKEEIDNNIEAINASIANSDSSIVIINEKLQDIDSSWDYYYTKEEINNTIEDINTSINNISTRVDNIDSSWNNYYTKGEINDNIESINTSIANSDSSIVIINEKLQDIDSSWDNYYDKTSIDASIIEYALPKGEYLTEHQDLSLLATKFEVSTGYYNKHEVDSLITTTGTFSPEMYYTKTDINEMLVNNTSAFITLNDTSKFITSLDVSQFITLNDTSIYLTEHQSLEEYDNSIESLNTSVNTIEEQLTTINSSWTNYYDKASIDTSIIEYAQPKGEYLTEQSLEEYAKIADVSDNINKLDISIKNSDASIAAVKEILNNINSSWSNYLTVEEFNNIVNADADETINKFNEIVDFLDGIDPTDNTLYNTLYSINASINNVSTRLNNIDSSWNNYYIKDEINTTIEDINTSINNTNSSIVAIKSTLESIDSSWDNYYDKTTIDASIIEYALPKGEYLTNTDLEDYVENSSITENYVSKNDASIYLTEHQSLDEYAKIADADASIAELKESIENADASISNITTRLDDIDSSWQNYYSKEELNSTIDNINDAISRADTSIAEIKESLSSNQNYYSTDEIDSIIGTVNASISNTDASIVDIKAAIENIDSSWQNYYDKTTIDASIIEYAQPKGEYLIANDISTKADKSELPTKVSDLQNDSEYVTNASMNARFTELIGAAPEAYDTLKEIADKLGDDDASLGTLFSMLADKSDVSTTYTKDQVDSLLAENYLTNTEVSTLLQDYALNASINTIFNTNDSNVDLEIADPSGNTLVAFYGGHMRTKYFDSAAVNSSIDGLIDTINSGALLPTIGEDPSSNDPNDIYWFIAGQKTEYRATPKIINISASDYQALSEKDETAIYVITDAFNNINGNNIEYTIGNVSSTSNINDLDVSIHKNNNVVSFDFTLPIANIDMSNLTEQQLALLQGKSNYDIYVENHDSAIDGSLLSEAEWLETLKGTTGDEGKSAYQLYVDAYEIANGDTAGVMTQTEWLNSLTPQINADASNNLYWYINGNKSQYKAFPEIRYITAAEYDALTDTDDSIIYIITSSQDASALSFNVGTVTTTDTDTDVSVNIRRVNSSVYFDFVLPFSVDSSKYRGKSAYQSYLDTLPSGTEPMTEANWVNSLRGKSAYEMFLEANPTTPYDTSAKWFASLKGADGSTGPQGPQGPATDVSIDSDGYWVINGIVTNKSARGIVPNISMGLYHDTNTNEDVAMNTWWIDGIDTHIPTSQGVDVNTLEARLGQLGNKVNPVPATYYTAEEATAYNTEHGLSSGDPGYVSEGDLKTAAIPAVVYTVKDYVDDHQPNIDTSNLYTKSEVDQMFADLINSAPATLDTLKEIADKLSADDTSLGELHTILSNKCDTSTTYTKTLVDTLLQSYVTTEYFNEHNTGGSGSIDTSALADYALKTYVDSKIGTLPNKTDDVYYTQEECNIYNTSNNLTSEDEGFLTTSTIKDPSTQYTDVVDAIEETEEVIAAMLINFNNSINDISSRVATLSATPTPAIWVGTQSEYNLLDPISETTIYIIKADTSLS